MNIGITTAILAAAAQEHGFAIDKPSLGFTVRQIKQCRLIMDKRLISVGERPLRRVFVHPEHAAAFAAELPALMAQHQAEIAKALHIRRRASAKRKRARAAQPPKPIAKPVREVRRDYGKAPWTVNTPSIITSETKVTICPSPPEFGPAAKLLRNGT